ncbi:MAG: PAS domain S-box protein, partial [Burkholderiales bacterium]
MTRSLPVFDDLIVSDALPALVIGDAIDDCNEAARELFCSGKTLLCSLPLASFLPAVQPDGSDSMLAWHERVAAARAGLTQWFLWQFVRHDGGLIDALVHLEVEPAPDGAAPPRYHAPVRAQLRDLTQFRGIEWSRMQQALAGTAAIVFAKDIEGRYLFANRQFAELTGRPLDELLGRRDTEVLPPDMAEECGRNDSLVLAERRPIDFEEHGYLGGEPRTFLTLKFPLLRADGGAYGVWGIATDITTRKRAEEALQHAALAVSQADGDGLVQALTRYLATILKVDIALIGVIEGEGDGRVVRTIARWGDGVYLENFTYPLTTTPCQTVLEGFRLYPSRVREAFPDSHGLGPARIEAYAGYPLRGSDGSLLGVIAVLSRSPLEDEALIESVLKIFAGRAAGEIERRRAEDALRTSEASYRAMFDASEDAILVHDWDTGAIVDVNPKACRAYGFTAEEMLGLLPSELSSGEHPYTKETTVRLVERAKAGIPTTVEWHRKNKDGTLHWDEVHIKPAEIAGKRRILAFTREITARKLAEHALRESEEQYRSIFNASVDGLLLWNSDGKVVDITGNS